jgi:hypothetical protein
LVEDNNLIGNLSLALVEGNNLIGNVSLALVESNNLIGNLSYTIATSSVSVSMNMIIVQQKSTLSRICLKSAGINFIKNLVKSI